VTTKRKEKKRKKKSSRKRVYHRSPNQLVLQEKYFNANVARKKIKACCVPILCLCAMDYA
jgi:hypothetical protein